MKFCSKCGSYMKKTKNGFLCRKCGNLVQVRTQTKDVKTMDRSSSIYVADSSEDENVTVSQECPKCKKKLSFVPEKVEVKLVESAWHAKIIINSKAYDVPVVED